VGGDRPEAACAVRAARRRRALIQKTQIRQRARPSWSPALVPWTVVCHLMADASVFTPGSRHVRTLDAAISQEDEPFVGPFRRGLRGRQLNAGYPAISAELSSERRHQGSSLLQRLG
jgi:hypothetical protein